MPQCLTTNICLPSIRRFCQRVGPGPSIHILDDDSLLDVFYLYRPALLDDAEDDEEKIWRGGQRGRDYERWWYKLTHVCRRWRCLILGSASHLGLGLLCKYNTPIADMLAHSPPLPLIIHFIDPGPKYDLPPNHGDGVILALNHPDRVRRIHLWTAADKLQSVITAIDCEFPILEHLDLRLYNVPDTRHVDATLRLAFRAPRLRHILSSSPAFFMGSPLLSTTTGISVLWLHLISIYPPPANDLIQLLSLMPHLEILDIDFKFTLTLTDFGQEGQLLQTQITNHVTLPNLRWLRLGGSNPYLELLLAQMATPRLGRFRIWFFDELTFSVPCLLQFISANNNLIFGNAVFNFDDTLIDVAVYPSEESRRDALNIIIASCFAEQISWIAQIFSQLSPAFSAVEHLTLETEEHSVRSAMQSEVDWRRLLRSLSNVKTLHVADGLALEVSRALQLRDGESPTELLPALEQLSFSGKGDVGDAFSPFIDARQNAGSPVSLVSHRTRLARR